MKHPAQSVIDHSRIRTSSFWRPDSDSAAGSPCCHAAVAHHMVDPAIQNGEIKFLS